MHVASTIINLLAISFSVGTASSVLLHDTNIDKAMVAALSVETANTGANFSKIGNDPHTHSERTSLYQAVRTIHSSQPRTQAKGQDDRRYIQAKPSACGHHPFDNYTLPVVA